LTAPISAIVISKDRLDHLQATLPSLMSQAFAEVVLVDYDCPAGSGEWAAAAFPGVRVVKVTGEPLFNAARARNLGARFATAPWLFFVDADVRVSPQFVAATSPALTPGTFVTADPCPAELCGTVLIHRNDFQAVGGYDEVFQGWGYEDIDLLDRLKVMGVRESSYDGDLAEPLKHEDDLRTRHHEIRSKLYNGTINRVYRAAKRDMAKLGKSLDEPARRRIYDQVRAGFTNGQTPNNVAFVFDEDELFGLTMTVSLNYRFSVTPPPDPEAP